jgi:hypothetical protein
MKNKLPICLHLCLILFALGSCAVFAEASSSPKTATTTSGSKATPSDAKDMKEITPPQVEQSSALKCRIGIPAWASAVSGQAGVRGNVSNIGYISFTNIIRHLDCVVPGSISVDYGKWGFLLEGQYVKLSEDFSVPISGPLSGPIGAKINPVVGGKVEMEQAFADFNVSYKVVATDKLTLAPFIGTRFEYVRINGSLQGSGPLEKSLDEDGSRAWADPILGLQAQYQIFKPTALVAKADVGGFGAASKLTYQFFAGAQTQITRTMYVSAGYRYLSTDYSSDGFAYKVAYQGPQITFGVNF